MPQALGRARRMDLGYAVFETALGHAAVAWSARGIRGFELPRAAAAAAERGLLRRTGPARRLPPPPAVAEAVALARRCFEGRRTDLSGVALDLVGEPPSPDFWAAARLVPWGETTTYGALAAALCPGSGSGPEGARAAGRAMARNPVPLFVPCHRVLAAGGRLGGFSAPGGAATKRRMLALEGVVLEPQAAFAF